METPKQVKQALKLRLKAVLLRLPPYFMGTFIHVYPEYKQQKAHVYNVCNYRSLDVNVIERLEQLAAQLENLSNSNK